jgi:thiol:disulfide interchange protein DsbA
MSGLLFACSGESPSTTSPQPQAAQQSRPAPEAPAAPAAQAESSAPAAPAPMSDAEREAAIATRNFQEGRHYQRLTPAQPTVETADEFVEVAEVFQYSCPACFNFEPYLEQWQASKPDYIRFVRIPAPWNPLSELHSRAFYTAEALGVLEDSHAAFFREFHVNRNYLETEDALADFYSQFGVDPEQFHATFNSFAVHTKLQRAKDLIPRYRVTGTPGIVVAGKYLTGGQMAQSYENWFAIIDELAAVERASR